MMNTKLQLRLINYFFWALIALVCFLVVVGMLGASTLVQRQKWLDHSNDVLSQVDDADKKFTEADLTARNRFARPVDPAQLEQMRGSALQSVDKLKELVRDNGEMTFYANATKLAMEERFLLLDRQLENANVQGDQIVYSKDQIAAALESLGKVRNFINTLKTSEMNLLRLERSPRLSLWQWRITYFAFFLIVLLFLTICTLFYLHSRLLRRLLTASEKFNVLLDQAKSTQLEKQLKEFDDYLQGVTYDFPT